MDWTPEEEKVLVERLRRRESRAFAQLVSTFQSRIYNLVFRMLADAEESRDVSQEIFVTVFRCIEQFRSESRLSTWIYRIATNHCHNRVKYLSRRGSNRNSPIDDWVEQADQEILGERPPRPDQQAAGHDMERAVQLAIRELDEEHRELIVLRDIQGISYEEIQDITGLPAGTVKSRLHRARLALRQRLAPLIEA